ncbi:keratinocyte-associated protein 2-like [Xenia sp. Carnegie-2017]|uniref:keratinocyte-associated protein 2-like n=1 Tax=Xenia sp. Carnegie-2017 TaxID=2897299 RepID=UPI001F03FCBF|nr:keratinocyte-associated protein 2-like [Xenia sp. Carnegie-2017]
MALPTSTSCVFSATLATLTFAAMMAFKTQLASKEWMTILGGFLGSQFFIFLLTTVGNFEHMTFGKNFQTKLVPEIAFCLMASVMVSGLVHRVCVTTCFIFSSIALYYMSRLSNVKYGPDIKPIQTPAKGKSVSNLLSLK